MSLDVRDLAAYVQLHLRGLMGKKTLLKVSSVRKLHQRCGGEIAEDLSYSAGWVETVVDGARTSWHDGSVDTFYCVVAIQPERGQAAVAIVNAGGPRGAAAATRAVERLLGISGL